MKTKTDRICPNIHRLVVHLYNPPRKGTSTGKGSRDFKTTHTFKEIKTLEEALQIIDQFTEGRMDNYSMIKKARYGDVCLVSDGIWVAKN